MAGLHPEGRESAKQRESTAPKAESVPRLEERTREELYALARRLEIPGHAEMTREELIEALRRR